MSASARLRLHRRSSTRSPAAEAGDSRGGYGLATRVMYMRIAAEIRDQIMAGTLAPGMPRCPRVTELAEDRWLRGSPEGEALQMLENQGLIWRVPGIGILRHSASRKPVHLAGRGGAHAGNSSMTCPRLEDHLFVFPEEDNITNWPRKALDRIGPVLNRAGPGELQLGGNDPSAVFVILGTVRAAVLLDGGGG